MKLENEFLSRLNHEIRTPLNSIMGFAELAGETDDIAVIKDCLAKITESSRKLLDVVDVISDFSNTDAAKEDAKAEMFEPIEKPHFDAEVLICEDNRLNQQVICANLEQIGIKTVVAENGLRGVEEVAKRMEKGEKPFDLIFMDMFMPVMGGIEAANEIIALKSGTPIVAMTANVMPAELEKYKKNGMPDCLAKPFTSQQLWRILLKYIKPAPCS